MEPALLRRDARSQLVADALESFDADVLCLQETTPVDLEFVQQRLGHRYELQFATNGPELWSNWGAPETPWEPNGTAVLFRAERFDELDRGSIELGPHGNVATWVRVHDRSNDDELQVVSLHLDSDDRDRRRAELPALFGAIAPAGAVIIAGDYNEDTITSDLGASFFDRGFVDVLDAVGRREPTHPYARPGDEWAALATIDHVLVRDLLPVGGEVVDAGVWAVEVPGERIEALLRHTGSDHLALRAEVARRETC
jgi:endonuclease/exonuclease/phosphatase family metal-dependent hydrolase